MPRFFCVESPFVEHCFLEEAERHTDRIRSRVTLRPELTNSWGGAHGGLIATLLDASMTVVARYAVDPDGRVAVATIDLATTFIGQAKESLVCEARIKAVRGSMIFAEAQVEGEAGQLVARAVGTLRAIKGA